MKTQACAHVCTSNAPPSNWVGNIVQVTRCQDVTASFWDEKYLSDYIHYVDTTNRTIGQASRHRHADSKILGRWHVSLSHVLNGRRWDTETQAVTDEFGWLVEVPR